jgi:AcrR family transcriptional regulator
MSSWGWGVALEVDPLEARSLEARSLEARLLEAARRALVHEPAERLSLRQVAREVGVSHQAPYIQFGTKRRFLAALAGLGLAEAAANAAKVVAAAGQAPLQRLHALVEAYTSFIRDQPHVHDLAYGPLVAKADHPYLQSAAISYWDLLHDVVAACQPAGVTDAETLRRCAATWGMVYGIARLDAVRQLPASVPGDRQVLIHEAVDTIYRGWRADPESQPDGTARAVATRRES